MSNPTERIPFEFDVKGDKELVSAFDKAANAYDKIVKANENAAKGYALAERAGLSYSRTLQQFSDKATGAIVKQEEAIKRLTRVQAEASAGGKGTLGFDKGDLADVAGNLEQVFTGGTKVTSVIRDLVTSGGIAGATFIALSAALDLVKTAIDNENKAFEAQRNAIARTSATFEEYQQRRRAAADENKTASLIEQAQTGFEAGRTQGTSVFDPKFAENLKKVESEQKRLNDTRQQGEYALGEIQNERIEKLSKEVIKLGEQGASLEDIFNKTVEIEKAAGRVKDVNEQNAAGLVNQARIYREIGEFQKSQKILQDFNSAQGAAGGKASDTANQYIQQIQDLQTNRNKSLQDAAAQHEKKLSDIAEQGAKQRLSIQESYSKQLANADETLAGARTAAAEKLNDSRAQAVEDYNTRLADLDRTTQETRVKQTEDYGKRIADIEARYQEQVKSINSNYNDSLEDIVARRDARALVNARKARDKQLTEADNTREKDKRSAEVDYQAAQRDLQKSLDTQRESIKRDYDKRTREAQSFYQKSLQDAQANYTKQLQQAQQARQEQLSALQRSLSEQRNLEAQAYRERTAAIQQSFAERLTAIGQALAREKDLSVQYGRQIIDSFKNVLNADEVRKVVGAFQDALQAKVDIKITPIVASAPTGSPSGISGPSNAGSTIGYSYAYGGYNERARLAQLHADELILPLSNRARTNQLINQYVAPRASMAGGSQSISINGRIQFDGAAVTAQMQETANQQIISVIQESLKGVKLGVRT